MNEKCIRLILTFNVWNNSCRKRIRKQFMHEAAINIFFFEFWAWPGVANHDQVEVLLLFKNIKMLSWLGVANLAKPKTKKNILLVRSGLPTPAKPKFDCCSKISNVVLAWVANHDQA